MKSGLYVYGIIGTGDAQDFGDVSIGQAPSRVFTVGYKGIAAVVSRSPWTVYDSLAKEKAVKDLVTHQFVIEKVLERFTIMPVKFGTMVEDEKETITFLEKGYTLLCEELRKMEGKVELDVVAGWDLAKIIASIYHQNKQIQKKQEEIARKGSTVSVEDKVALGVLTEQDLNNKKVQYHQSILQTLKKASLDVCLHDAASEEMIFNAAFLLERKNEQSFHDTLGALDQELESTVHFRVVGPLPPYSFATVLFERIDPHVLEEAKKTFGLHGEITAKTVRDAYRQLAQKCHPDTSKREGVLDFHRIHTAYRILNTFIDHGQRHVEMYRWEKDAQISEPIAQAVDISLEPERLRQ